MLVHGDWQPIFRKCGEYWAAVSMYMQCCMPWPVIWISLYIIDAQSNPTESEAVRTVPRKACADRVFKSRRTAVDKVDVSGHDPVSPPCAGRPLPLGRGAGRDGPPPRRCAAAGDGALPQHGVRPGDDTCGRPGATNGPPLRGCSPTAP